jgi:hypothetical protein
VAAGAPKPELVFVGAVVVAGVPKLKPTVLVVDGETVVPKPVFGAKAVV